MDAYDDLAALTAQNTRGVRSVHVPPAACVARQIDAIFADIRVDAVKIGMLATAGIAEVVADALLRHQPRYVVLDPVMPKSLDGLRARLDVHGRSVEVTYRIARRGCSPAALTLNGTPLAFEREPNPYRPGAARVAMSDFIAHGGERNALIIDLE